MKNLSQIRDLLLPVVWDMRGEHYPGTQAEITVSDTVDALIVSAWKEGKEPLAFAITRLAIEDGVYLRTFPEDFKTLLEKVSQE